MESASETEDEEDIPVPKPKKKTRAGPKFEKGRVYVSLCTYKFERIIIDEAHVMRNTSTLLAESIRQTLKNKIHFLTATPMLNACKDLRGYLFQIFQDSWEIKARFGFLEQYDPGFDPSNVVVSNPKLQADDEPEYMNVLPPMTSQNAAFLTAVAAGVPLYVLDPRHFFAAGNQSNWSPDVMERVLPPILRLLMIRVGWETAIDLEDGSVPRRIGEDIPACYIFTVQIKMNRKEKREYDDRTLHLMSSLYTGALSDVFTPAQLTRTTAHIGGLTNLDSTEGIMNNGIYRFMKHCCIDPRLGKLTYLNHREMSKKERQEAAKLRRNNWTGVDLDNGASFFFVKTRAAPHYAIPSDRLALAQYLAAFSPKSRVALGYLSQWVLGAKEKAILVFEFQMCLW